MKKEIFILVVDDNQENLRVVVNYLQDKGYQMALALDGGNALKILETSKIDLILLDIMMPEMDGFEVCKIIKANDATKDIPIIFLTALTETNDIVKGFELGGVDYITKPFIKEELFARVSAHIKIKMMLDYLKDDAEYARDSRNSFMRSLLDFGKLIDPQD